MKIKNSLKTPEGAAFAASLSTGFVAHLFALTNVIHNYDSVLRLPYDYGGGIPLGRWGLQLLGEFAQRWGGNTNLPLVNGLIYLVLVALSAAILVKVFSIRDRKHAILIGMVFAVFPASVSTMIHRYCAVYYGISMLLAVSAVWVIHRHKIWGSVLSVLMITMSLGIYQAYIPVTIAAFILLLIQQALRGEEKILPIIKRGLHYAAVLIVGLVLYFLIQQLAMNITGISMDDYQGISDMGKTGLAGLLSSAIDAIYLVIMLPMRDYCGISDAAGLRLAWVLLGGVTVCGVLYILITRVKKVLKAILILVLCILFLLGANFIYVMCPGGLVYTLMVYGIAVILIAPAVILECIPEETGKKWKQLASKLIAVGMAVLIIGYAYLANTNYTAMYYADRQVENYMSSMVTQVRMTEGYTADKEWAFLGEISDPNLWFTWRDQMNYGGFTGPDNLLACHSTYSWMKYYTGYHPQMATPQRIAELAALDEVKAMPCWPDAGSIKAVGNTMVIKCEELN